MSSFTRGDWRLEWEHHGEGYSGDYDEDDPDDKPLLRADLYYKGEMLTDGSYCTMTPDDTSEDVLKRFSDDLFDKLENHRLEDDERFQRRLDDGYRFNDRIMQEWTWRTEP